MSFFDKIKTNFDDESMGNTPKKEENNKKEIKTEQKKEEIKKETMEENNVKKTNTKSEIKTPKAIISDGSEGNKKEDDFLNALNQNIIKKEEKLEKTETQEDEKTDEIEIKNEEEAKKSKISINEILDLAIENNVSDIHFSEGGKVAMRIHGEIRFINEIDKLSKKDTLEHVEGLLYHDKNTLEKYTTTKEMDCAYEHPSGINFRVNLFFKRKKMAGVLRRIESKAMKFEDLGIPKSIKSLLEKKQGLLLVTGPTGSGKSTSMQSMLQYVNETRIEHILTIEDPVEFIFTNDKSIFSQREVGSDTKSFHNALKAALREDPDIIMIGEMRDQETINAAMHLAETGHLVISTLHTSSAAQTVSRLVSTYPSDEQDQVQSRLSDALIGVLSQRLVKTRDGKGRAGIFEVLIVNTAVRNIIKTGDMGQMGNAMLSGRNQGMVRMQDYADDLATDGIISQESYQGFFKSE